jgi:hypothetical protein
MEYACATVASLATKLKREFQLLVSASPMYGKDTQLTRQIDALGQTIKEMEDAVIVLQIHLEEDQLAERPDETVPGDAQGR